MSADYGFIFEIGKHTTLMLLDEGFSDLFEAILKFGNQTLILLQGITVWIL